MSSRNSADLTKRTIAFAWKKFRTSKKKIYRFFPQYIQQI